jgi:hypothetical protein
MPEHRIFSALLFFREQNKKSPPPEAANRDYADLCMPRRLSAGSGKGEENAFSGSRQLASPDIAVV